MYMYMHIYIYENLWSHIYIYIYIYYVCYHEESTWSCQESCGHHYSLSWGFLMVTPQVTHLWLAGAQEREDHSQAGHGDHSHGQQTLVTNSRGTCGSGPLAFLHRKMLGASRRKLLMGFPICSTFLSMSGGYHCKWRKLFYGVTSVRDKSGGNDSWTCPCRRG